MQRDSIQNTFIVATGVCVFWSVLVSTAAVGLRERQEANKVEERKRNILVAAGLYDENVPLVEAFEQVKSEIVDLETGEPVDKETVDPEQFDQRAAAKDPDLGIDIKPEDDLAGIKRREKYSFVYWIEKKNGDVDQYVLPINGKGLWSTLYGFIALDGDMKKIRGITFYEHAETPGLGGEVDNPSWKAKWVDQHAFDDDGNVRIEVVRGTADPNSKHQVDGIGGATLTARGVSNLVQYWLGKDGFGPFLDKRRKL
jgi:Na+-transporting NADH:ubiquinone oxidoreductase subunit C